MGFTISLINITTSNTFSTGISWVNINDGHASKHRFIFNKLCKLMKSPTVMCGSLLFPNSSPSQNALQIFKGDRGLCVFGFSNDSLADYMISMCCKTSFFFVSFFKKSFSRYSPFLLQFLSDISISATNREKMISGKIIPCGQGSNIFNTPIYTNNIFKIFWFGCFNIASSMKVKYTIYQNKVCFSLLKFKKFLLSFSTNIRNFETTSNSPDRNNLFFSSPRKDATIISYCSEQFKLSLGFLVKFIGINNLNNTLNNNLSGQAKGFLNCSVKKFLEIILSKNLINPSPFADMVTCFITHKNSLFQKIRLFFIWQEFYLCSKFHNNNLSRIDMFVKQKTKEIVLLPNQLKIGLGTPNYKTN